MIMNLYCDDLEVEILARENALEVDILTTDIMSELSFFNESVFMESEENTSVLKKVADKKGLSVVVEKNTVVFGGADITDEVAKSLQSGK